MMAKTVEQDIGRLRRRIDALRKRLETFQRKRAEEVEQHKAQLEQVRAVRDGLRHQRDQFRARLAMLAEEGSDGRYSGCYLLMKLGVPIYVGQSVNIFGRIAAHRSVNSWPTHGDFDEVRLIWCAHDELDATERRLIEELRPRHNVEGVTRPYKRAPQRRRSWRLPADLFGPVHTTIAQQEVAA